MAEPKWKQILNGVSEAERSLAKEILRKNLQKRGKSISDEALEEMADKALKDARAMIRKKGRQAFRGLKVGFRAFWEELKRETKE